MIARAYKCCFLPVCVSLACVVCAPNAHAQFATNLIVNPDAEAGVGSPTGDVVAVPGWSTTGNFTAVQYGAGGGFPLLSDPGPSNRGNNFFAGGPNNGASSATQTVDVSAGASIIDAGGVTYTLSSYLGGFASQDDNATLTATFLSASNATLGSASIGSVFAADRNNLTGLLFRMDNGSLPVGVRNIALTLDMVRLEGSYNDGYADNLSLVLTAQPMSTPEPSSVALLLSIGTMGAGFLIRHRKQARYAA